jgi:uncharacterized repeat protein (TIGR03987 family)
MLLVFAIVFITLALVLYTTAVWWERAMRILKGRHLLLFWLGFCCDTAGTTLMGRIAGGPFRFNFHGITGLLAILLMLFHAAWGTVVHAGKRLEPKQRFHRFSVVVWAAWLIPYLSGVIFGMGAGTP